MTVDGLPWVESHFSTKFSATKNRAGLAHLHFHDLRGTSITVLGETGARILRSLPSLATR
jgi:hypothetical protein